MKAMYYNMEDYDDMIPGYTILETWFGSDIWDTICNDAEEGDEDSIELMETIADDLTSLVFHAENKSPQSRIEYELAKFQKLIYDFDVK